MDHDIARIDQHPVAQLLPFDVDEGESGFLEFLGHVVGQRADMAVGKARRNNHAVGKAAFSDEINGNDVFCFIVIERFFDELLNGFAG